MGTPVDGFSVLITNRKPGVAHFLRYPHGERPDGCDGECASMAAVMEVLRR